jgi:hypothetical protein
MGLAIPAEAVAQPPGWSSAGTIQTFSAREWGADINLPGTTNPMGCTGVGWVRLETTQANYQSVYALALTAAAGHKSIQFWIRAVTPTGHLWHPLHRRASESLTEKEIGCISDCILRDMDLAVTVHGFPSTFRDWVAEQTDYSGEIAEAALAHTVSNKVEAAYRRIDFLDKRRLLMCDWGLFCKMGQDAPDYAGES